MNANELKPCPFCGKTPFLTQDMNERQYWMVHCCVSTPWMLRKLAVARWNGRFENTNNATLTMKNAEDIEPGNLIETGHGIQTWKEVKSITKFFNNILSRNQVEIKLVPGPWIDCEGHVRECEDLISVIERVK